MRGLFLRGYGAQTSSHYGSVVHQSGELGMIQGDAIRNITGSSGDSPRSGVYYYGALAGGAGGARKFAGEGLRGRSALNFDASRVVPTASENRPVNQGALSDPRPALMLAKQAWRRSLKKELWPLRQQESGLAQRVSAFSTAAMTTRDGSGSTVIWLRKPESGSVPAR